MQKMDWAIKKYSDRLMCPHQIFFHFDLEFLSCHFLLATTGDSRWGKIQGEIFFQKLWVGISWCWKNFQAGETFVCWYCIFINKFFYVPGGVLYPFAHPVWLSLVRTEQTNSVLLFRSFYYIRKKIGVI